jgi:hypothetical protein
MCPKKERRDRIRQLRSSSRKDLQKMRLFTNSMKKTLAVLKISSQTKRREPFSNHLRSLISSKKKHLICF